MGQTGIMTPKQRRFVSAMLTSRTVAQAADLAQISRKTGERWLSDANVKAALTEAQSVALGGVTRQLVDAMSGAIGTLEAIHTDTAAPATARVSAARAILDSGLKYAELVDLAQRVTELEARIT